MSTKAAFEKAAVEVKKLKEPKPDDTEQLKLYVLYKIAREEDITKAKTPGWADLRAKYKYNAWQKEVDNGTTPAEAQKKYTEFVKELQTKYS